MLVLSHVWLCDPMDPTHLTKHLCTWDFPGKNIGVNYHSFLQRIFPTQVSNPSLLHYRQILYYLSYREVLKKKNNNNNA